MEQKECVKYRNDYMPTVPDTPPVSVWREYNQRKADLFRQYGHGVEYDRALRELIEELGV